MTAKPFGLLPDGRQAHLYKIRFGSLDAEITDFGATLVSLTVPVSRFIQLTSWVLPAKLGFTIPIVAPFVWKPNTTPTQFIIPTGRNQL